MDSVDMIDDIDIAMHELEKSRLVTQRMLENFDKFPSAENAHMRIYVEIILDYTCSAESHLETVKKSM